MSANDFSRLFIGGEWVLPHSGRTIASIDPSTEEVWTEAAEGDETDIDNAVKAAKAAFDGPWRRKITASQRGTYIHRLAELVRRDVDALAMVESRDNGKPLRDTKSEILRAADRLVFYAGAADKINGEQIPFRPDALAYTRLEPVGIVGAILPWNSPIALATWKIGAALATGNTLVLKPAEQTPVSILALARLIEEAGFPAGAVNVVPGYGAIAGNALTTHQHVNKISFTGDHKTAQKIMTAASATLKRCLFECGGKSPHIIFDDADLDRAVTMVVHSAFRSTGQSCSLGSRLFVQRKIYDAFLQRVAEKTAAIRVGMPLDPKTHIGPQTSAEQLEKTMGYILGAKADGARLVTGGGRPAGLPKGYFVQPTIFADVDNRSRLAQEEIFGPVMAAIPFDTEEEVVIMANDVKYGLVAGFWTKDVTRAHRVAAELEAGLVSVNTFRPTHWTLPYGGFKMSGIGRESGMAALKDYTETKVVVIELSDKPADDPFKD
jgi:acyl-CoA reductase-like NAD-dependent aldehyde dehydrogenase